MKAPRVAVIGGGLGGLAAAALLARGGCAVTLHERSKHLGGRGQTSDVEGFRFNLGPHALYQGGTGMRVLGALGVKPPGGMPGAGSYLLSRGRLQTMPRGLVSMLTTDALGLAGKLELAKLLAGLGRVDLAPLANVTLRDWVARHLSNEDARAILLALTRVTTYCADADAMSAQAALTLLQARPDVLYVDGGWSTLVSALEARAREAGAALACASRVGAVLLEETGARVRGVRLADGTELAADAVVVAGGPGALAELLPGDAALARDAARAVPVKAATLELGLSRLPRPDALFALGTDGPWYASVHSAVARLAPEGGAMVHVMQYLGGRGPEASEARLEDVMDALQPGWRTFVVARRYRPSLLVSNWLPTAETGGLGGRPSVEVPHVRGLYRVGDWVGPEGQLAEGAFASAEAAARALVAGPRAVARRAAGR
ncbi:phytoene desaturase family protein [Corallococcus macrosporus]|uniref:Amine oxidase n=1 Tax=Corallococcus macrosporus DSM 14697 TaxID=1189310 RepID=A0A250JLX0_9BACT|nr:FAD-dependent oxidoreductase [Corallococcus macrosporus]ATB44640.1 amine oxidase [Corallococcus macrosporus DSM 14697]